MRDKLSRIQVCFLVTLSIAIINLGILFAFWTLHSTRIPSALVSQGFCLKDPGPFPRRLGLLQYFSSVFGCLMGPPPSPLSSYAPQQPPSSSVDGTLEGGSPDHRKLNTARPEDTRWGSVWEETIAENGMKSLHMRFAPELKEPMKICHDFYSNGQTLISKLTYLNETLDMLASASSGRRRRLAKVLSETLPPSLIENPGFLLHLSTLLSHMTSDTLGHLSFYSSLMESKGRRGVQAVLFTLSHNMSDPWLLASVWKRMLIETESRVQEEIVSWKSDATRLAGIQKNIFLYLNSNYSSSAASDEDLSHMYDPFVKGSWSGVLGGGKIGDAASSSNSQLKTWLGKSLSDSVNDLESRLNQDEFEKSQKKEGAKLETVVKLSAGSETGKSTNSTATQDGGSSTLEGDIDSSSDKSESEINLIDNQSNVYVLSKPSDITSQYEDPIFLQDLIMLWSLSYLLGHVMKALLGLPAFVGYIIAGLVGPDYF